MSEKTKSTETEKPQPTATDAAKAEAAKFGAKFKVAKKLTQPLLKLVNDLPVYVTIQDKMYLGKKVEEKKDPAMLVHVVDLTTGEECLMILSAVVQGVFKDEYPDDAYVGKSFSICKQAKRPGKAYNEFIVNEIVVPN
jgi:hypothetical protein